MPCDPVAVAHCTARLVCSRSNLWQVTAGVAVTNGELCGDSQVIEAG